MERTGTAARVVLITGASGGLGHEVTRMFAAAGDNVVLVSRHHDRLEDLAAALGIPDTRCLLKEADLSDPAQSPPLVTEVVDCFGRIDVVVNLMGSYAPGRIAATTNELWRAQIASNLDAVFYLLREAIPSMRDGGAIVNSANSTPVEGRGGQLAHAVAKGGVITLTKSLALELKPRGIRVNAILPRNVDTPGNRALQPDADPTPWPSPQKVAEVIFFLCSDAAAVVSGALVPVYGQS